MSNRLLRHHHDLQHLQQGAAHPQPIACIQHDLESLLVGTMYTIMLNHYRSLDGIDRGNHKKELDRYFGGESLSSIMDARFSLMVASTRRAESIATFAALLPDVQERAFATQAGRLLLSAFTGDVDPLSCTHIISLVNDHISRPPSNDALSPPELVTDLSTRII